MLKVGLIGCGGMGSVHATVWSEMTDKARLVAVAELNQDKWKKFADNLGAKFYTDANEMMEKEDLDVVDQITYCALFARRSRGDFFNGFLVYLFVLIFVHTFTSKSVFC